MKKTVIYIVCIVLVVLIGVTLFFRFSEESMDDLLPAAKGNLFILEWNEPARIQMLKDTLSASDAVSATYGIEGLENSKVILDILKYPEDTYLDYLNFHMSTDTVRIGNSEVDLPCTKEIVENQEIRSCQYSSGDVSIVKYTFPIDKDMIVRVLCVEGYLPTAQAHCTMIAQGVLK